MEYWFPGRPNWIFVGMRARFGEPGKNVPRAIRGVVPRTLILYVGSIASLSAFGFFFSWIVIAVSHLRFRPAVLASEPWRLKFRSPASRIRPQPPRSW